MFPDNEGERRYATVAELVRQATDPSSIILASIHTGPIRYYAGRDTMRFDLLNEAWLDRAVAWLTAHGRHPYFLIEDWERPIFEKRFAAMNSLGRLATVSRARLPRLSAFPAPSISSTRQDPRPTRSRRPQSARLNPGVRCRPRHRRWPSAIAKDDVHRTAAAVGSPTWS